jgi:hypothetical protein
MRVSVFQCPLGVYQSPKKSLMKRERTHQPHGTKHIPLKRPLPLLQTPIRNLLHWFQRAVIDDQCVQTAPALQREIHGFGSERRVRHVAGEYFDALRAVLVVEFVEGGVCAGDEDEFV